MPCIHLPIMQPVHNLYTVYTACCTANQYSFKAGMAACASSTANHCSFVGTTPITPSVACSTAAYTANGTLNSLYS